MMKSRLIRKWGKGIGWRKEEGERRRDATEVENNSASRRAMHIIKCSYPGDKVSRLIFCPERPIVETKPVDKVTNLELMLVLNY